MLGFCTASRGAMPIPSILSCSGDWHVQTEPLTETQRELVQDHLHLVRRHVQRYARRTRRPTREREIEDLYQEGCLGLIQAARTYDPASGIPFQSYAFMRIRHGVSLALHGRFTTIGMTMRQRFCRRKNADPSALPLPMVVSLECDPEDPASHPSDDPDEEATSAEAFRRRLESAVQRAGVVSNRRGRPDQAELIDSLIQNRLLIPDDEYKRSLRQIARETKSSYARVAACEQKLLARIRQIMKQQSLLSARNS